MRSQPPTPTDSPTPAPRLNPWGRVLWSAGLAGVLLAVLGFVMSLIALEFVRDALVEPPSVWQYIQGSATLGLIGFVSAGVLELLHQYAIGGFRPPATPPDPQPPDQP